MVPLRLIARLDIKGPNVVKGIHMEGLRVVGAPGTLAGRYYAQGIDEIIYIDIVASLYGRSNILDMVRQAAHSIFVPLTVGGGLRSTDDIVAALRSGADKVAINTAAIARPAFLKEAAQVFGSQCIVLSIEAKQRGPNKWEALTDNGRQTTGVDVLDWARQGERLGAGEILVTSVDREGTRKGLDIELLKRVRECVGIPVIGCGGAGGGAHMIEAASAVDAVACASLFHVDGWTVGAAKAALRDGGVAVRQ